MTLEEAIAKIKPLDHNAMEIAQKRWDSIAKPLHSLGKLETLLIQIAGITGNAEVDLSRRGLIAMCADNGVVEEGVTQTGQEVTAIVAENFLKYSVHAGPDTKSLPCASLKLQNTHPCSNSIVGTRATF